jgi:hypothetical protein
METEPRGRKTMPITDVTSRALRKEGNCDASWLFWMKSLKEGVMRYIDVLLGNNDETINYTTAVFR